MIGKNELTSPRGPVSRRRYGWWLALLLLLLLLAAAPLHAEQAKRVIGWVEKVAIYPGNLVVRARIDTGAKTASLNCSHVQWLKRNGQDWVRCKVVNTKGKAITLKRRVVRTVTIKQHLGGKQNRPVISLGLCLAGVYKQADVDLADRSGFNYQMLIGRNFLGGDFLVDPARTFLSAPRCTDASEHR